MSISCNFLLTALTQALLVGGYMKVRGLVIPDDFPKSSRTAVWTNEERIRQYLAFLDLLERYNLDNTGFFANDEFSLATIVRMHHAELEEVN